MKEFFKLLLKFIGIFLVDSLAASLVMLIFTIPFFSIVSNYDMLYSNSYFYMLSLYGMFVTVFIVAGFEKKKIRQILNFEKGQIKKSLCYAGIGLCIGIGLTLLWAIGMLLAGASITWKAPNLFMILLMLFGFMIQSYSEELLFREYFLSKSRQLYGVEVCCIMNGVFFSLAHFMNNDYSLLPFLSIALLGYIFSNVTLHFKNIHLAGAIHTGWNFSLCCILGVSVSGLPLFETSFFQISGVENTLLSGGGFGPEASIITVIVFVISLCLVRKLCR